MDATEYLYNSMLNCYELRPPAKSKGWLLTEPTRPYIPADHTNIAKTFDRVCPGWRKKRV